MKRIISVILIISVFLSFLAFAEELTTKLYAPDGVTVEVPAEQVESYIRAGYGRSRDDVITKLYSTDGRSIVIFDAEVPAYLKVGWMPYEDAIVTLYTMEGKTLTIFKGEEATYLNLGWSRYEDITTTLYSYDGRCLTIFNNEVDTYLNLGWHYYEDAIVTLYAGENTLTIFKNEEETYLNLGWHKSKLPDPTKPIIAFSFDDGPHHTYTKSVIDTLTQYGCTATFFMLGRLAASYPDVVKYAVSSGMEIANHSYNHANLAQLSAYGVQNDVSSATSNIYAAGGVYPTLLRPPYGSYNNTVKANAGLPLILWSVDTLDWKSRNAYSVYNHILSNAKDGDIVLMHDIYSSTAEAVKMVVPELVRRGFQIVSVSELAKAKGYNLSAGNVYSQIR